MRHVFFVVLASWLAGWLAAPLAGQTPTPLGGEFQVNSTTAGAQEAPVIVTDAVGNFIVVWQSNGQDGSGLGIYARRYSRVAGAPLSGEVRINDTTAGNQQTPAASMTDGGNLAVVWESPDGSGSGIFVKVLSSTGATLVSEQQVNLATTGNQRAPSVALSESGSFLVVWQGPSVGLGEGIFGRVFNAAGTALTLDLPIDTTVLGDQVRPLARPIDALGLYVTVWQGPDGSGLGVFGQPLSALGVLLGGELAINGTIAGDQARPALAVDDDGSFSVVWEAPDGDARGIFLRPYDSSGVPLSSEVQVNESIVGDQFHPDVAQGESDADANTVVVWTTVEAIEGMPIFISGRRGVGGAFGGSSEFLVSENGTMVDNPTVTAEEAGDIAVAWESQGQDTSGNGVYARRFSVAPLFRDGFESGDTSAWSATVP